MGKNIYTWESAVILTFFMSWWYSQWYSHKICEFPMTLVCFFPGSCLSSPSSSAPTIQELGLPLIFRRNSHSLMTHGSRCCELGTGLPQKRDVKITMKWGFRWLHHIYPTIKFLIMRIWIHFAQFYQLKSYTVSFQDKFTIKWDWKWLKQTSLVFFLLEHGKVGGLEQPGMCKRWQCQVKAAKICKVSAAKSSLRRSHLCPDIFPDLMLVSMGISIYFSHQKKSGFLAVSHGFCGWFWMISCSQLVTHCLERRSSRKAAPEPRSWILSIFSCSPLVWPCRHGIRDVTTFWPWYWRCWRAGGQVFQGDGRFDQQLLSHERVEMDLHLPAIFMRNDRVPGFWIAGTARIFCEEAFFFVIF